MPRKQDVARMLLLVVVAALVAATLAVVTNRVTRSAQSEPIPAHLLVNSPAPDFALQQLGGGEVKLADLRGKIVVLDFWATWCPPCVKSLPGTQAVAEAYADKGVAVFAVNIDDTPQQIEQFYAEQKLKMPTLLGAGTGVGQRYAVKYIPQFVVIDANGIVRAADSVGPDEAHDWMTREIERARH